MAHSCDLNQSASAVTLDVEQLRVGDRVAERRELVKRPDHSFCLRLDFDQQRLTRASMAIADHVVAIGDNLQRGDPGQGDARKIALLDLPDDLLVRSHLKDRMSIPRRDQRVTRGQSHGGERLITKGFRSVSVLRGLPNSGTWYSQTTSPVWWSYSRTMSSPLAHQIIATGDFSDKPCVRVGVGMIDLQPDLFEQSAVTVDLNDPFSP